MRSDEDINEINLELRKKINYRKEFYERYELAMEAKKAGNIDLVIELLTPSVIPPSIYNGHYRELFIAYRNKNKKSIKEGNIIFVIIILKKMLRLDNEMIDLMYHNWSRSFVSSQDREYFFSQSNIKITDMKLLLKLSTKLYDSEGLILAKEKIQCIENYKKWKEGIHI